MPNHHIYTCKMQCDKCSKEEWFDADGEKHLEVIADMQAQIYPKWISPNNEKIGGIQFVSSYTWLCASCSQIYRDVAAVIERVKASTVEHTGAQRIYDKWCIWSAIRLECELAGIETVHLQDLPLYVPWGATRYAPFGLANEDCQYPVLKKGGGVLPKYWYPSHISHAAAIAHGFTVRVGLRGNICML